MWDNTLKKKITHKLGRGQIVLKVCPFCSNDRFNIEVSVEKGIYHCWICNASGKVWKLFKELGIPFEDDGLKVSTLPTTAPKDELSIKPFSLVKWDTYKTFLEARGLDQSDIDRYHILTTDKGKFRGKIIFPLYEGFKLVYIVGRDSVAKGRYYNINILRSSILPYYLGKTDKTTIHLCEGIFDAISINKLGYTSGVLLGTVLSNEQIRKIEAFGFKTVVVCLDGDALDKAIKMFDMVSKHGFHTRIVLFHKLDDPNSVFVRDKAELKHALKNHKEVSIKDRVQLKIKS